MTVAGTAALNGTYDYLAVGLSALIAVSASYAALDLAGRVTAARARARLAWLTGGALVMGTGIWSMHFTAMLAFRLPIPVRYHWPTVLAALLSGVLASAVALYVSSRQKMGLIQALTGSVIMGGGISALHYIGIAAMRLAAETFYNALLVSLSAVLAIVFSLVALLLAFDLREKTRGAVPRKIGSALVMGAAIAAMHYTAMAAASFVPAAVTPDASHTVSVSSLETVGVGAVTLMVLSLAVFVCSVSRRLGAYAEDLERRVVERTSQLTAANEQLRAEMAERQQAEAALQETQAGLARVMRAMSMGELVASIAHEVDQPLTAVVTNANFCLRLISGGAPNLNQLREAITEIVNDGMRASAVISRVRTMLVKGAPERVQLDFNNIIREVISLVHSEVTRNGVTVRTELASDLPTVTGDRVQLEQVLINLVVNSIDAMRKQQNRPRNLVIRSATNPDGVLIQVQDSGPGLAPEQADRIFEPFFTTKSEGIGMGLSISRSIVESHGGRLWTVPGSDGALFQFTLPASVR